MHTGNNFHPHHVVENKKANAYWTKLWSIRCQHVAHKQRHRSNTPACATQQRSMNDSSRQMHTGNKLPSITSEESRSKCTLDATQQTSIHPIRTSKKQMHSGNKFDHPARYVTDTMPLPEQRNKNSSTTSQMLTTLAHWKQLWLLQANAYWKQVWPIRCQPVASPYAIPLIQQPNKKPSFTS